MKNVKPVLIGLSCLCMVAVNAWGSSKAAGEKTNKTLVVYYSYSHGNTKGIAERVGESARSGYCPAGNS